MTIRNTIGIVGAGLGGLAAACTLAARGHRVTVLERNRWIGGKAAVLEANGFRFDMGPTILTLPEVLARIFAEAGRSLDAELPLIRLDPQWRCFFEGGGVLDLHADTDTMGAALRAFAPGSDAGYRDFLALSQRLHAVSNRFFFWRAVDGLSDTMRPDGRLSVSTLKDVLSLRLGASVAGVIRRRVPDERVAQMLDHFTQYVGSNPYDSPAVLCAIGSMQLGGGVWYPEGGTRAVPVALERLAAQLGVEIRTEAAVRRILVEHAKAVGVELETGERIMFDAVVSNMDSVRTYRELVGAAVPRPPTRGYEAACSGVVLYLGLRRRYDHLLHHNFVFSRNAREEFDAIYGRGEPAADPSCYIAAPAVTDPSVAPDGGDALYVLVHTPYLRTGHDWSRLLPGYRRVIIDKLARVAGMADLEDRIVFEATLTPQDIQDRYNVLDGAIYGLASHGRFLGAFKPANRSRAVAGLYLAGGSAHPGPGMPMAMMSGWIAADALDRDLGGGGSRTAPASPTIAPA